ncbi:MAG: glycoside hydrolase family 95 protein, partial [Clostridiales bacterium]|nr:glycoside hydrolase family 95 protein [Clostridiales bacterium]
MKLFYTNPAASWNEALPIGNGFLGAMIFGGINEERIKCNEDSLWSKQRAEKYNPDALKNLAKIRELLFSGRISEAEELARNSIFSPDPNPAHYEPLGDLIINFNHEGEIKNYRRSLCIETAVATVSYEIDGVE